MRKNRQQTLTVPGKAPVGLALVCALTLTGCVGTNGSSAKSTFGQQRRSAEPFGKTYYLDGAGNWGFGSGSVPEGLKNAGYRGDVEIYVWTTSLNPLIDQLNIPGAKFRAKALSDRIHDYHKRYPNAEINIIALSAGTGVAIWAVEGLKDGVRIKNLILLGSSLSHNYDASRALRNMTGRIYVYHSPHDLVLGGVRVVGTIDGKRGVESAGAVGLDTPPGFQGRIVNIPWSKQYIPLGWAGAHTDCTCETFVSRVIARHIVPPKTPALTPDTGLSSAQAIAPPAAAP